MKIVLNTLATAAIIGTLALASGKIYSSNSENNADQLLSCHWFPICTDPSFQMQQEDIIEQTDPQNVPVDIKSLYACHWFPICKDPDQPLVEAVV
ncbi:MAG: hypothetical protein LAT66_13595 [Alkalimonas sp.]|nr:hypothetical protein [Alkalimonas sp.]